MPMVTGVAQAGMGLGAFSVDQAHAADAAMGSFLW